MRVTLNAENISSWRCFSRQGESDTLFFSAEPGVHGCAAAACSPCLKLKPVSKGKKSGFVMLNVEPYGGGLWHTWFDRDLSLAGRVLLRAADGTLQHRLVSPKPWEP